jgi:eukaryotic-like serine/threonine-protein kinase
MPAAGECIAGRYRLESPLGEGGMGSVWRAEHLGLHAPVAVKFQHRWGSRTRESRFRREARSAARLKNPHVVRIVDFGVDGQTPYLAMELLEGESLRDRLARQLTFSLADTLNVVRQAASAIDAAHAAGVVHRDLKPSNLFLAQVDGNEIVKLLDFGIAKWADHAEGATDTLTESDLVVGSASYMSPEQTRGDAVDGRTDVWALGAVAYQMLTGLLPFRGRNVPEAMQCIGTGRFEAPSVVLGATHEALDPVFARVFQVDRRQRYASGSEFVRALADAGSSLPNELTERHPAGVVLGRESATKSVAVVRPKAPRRRAYLALGAVALCVAIVAAVYRGEPTPTEAGPRVHAPTAPPAPLPSARPVEAAATAAVVAPTVASPSAAIAAPPLDPEPIERRATSARRPTRRSAPPGAERSPEPLSAAAPARPSPPASLVDPVFGLEVPAAR